MSGRDMKAVIWRLLPEGPPGLTFAAILDELYLAGSATKVETLVATCTCSASLMLFGKTAQREGADTGAAHLIPARSPALLCVRRGHIPMYVYSPRPMPPAKKSGAP